MKGISDVIAMLLMLVVTIGLVGLAYSYISGVFTARTSVVLNIDSSATTCVNSTTVYVYVRNDGTQASGSVSVTLYSPSGATISCTPIATGIPAGDIKNTTCTKSAGAGYYRIVASTTGSSASGMVYCSQ